MRSEAAYQRELVRKLKHMFPDCLVVKNDPRENQGIPDILILFPGGWAMLEVKKSEDAPHRPNQDYFVKKYDGWSFCAFIYPEIEERVLNDLQSAFGVGREARVS